MGKRIKSIEQFITEIKNVRSRWNTEASPWFRGEPDVSTPLLPKLYRPLPNGRFYNENRLLQNFRRLAPSLNQYKTPERGAIDEWLFLMQHVRLPTRLLDWTEGSLIALYFALENNNPVVWMLNPYGLNRLSTSSDFNPDAFPLTWFRPSDGSINIGHENIRGAWEEDKRGLNLPVAIKPTYIHPRMNAQKSCFTVHGKIKEPLIKIVPKNIYSKFIVDTNYRDEMSKDLRMLGVTHTTVFPEIEYLAKELEETSTIIEQ
ncbi:MAG: FRG domain-containing protein [Chloroflexota bacterium]